MDRGVGGVLHLGLLVEGLEAALIRQVDDEHPNVSISDSVIGAANDANREDFAETFRHLCPQVEVRLVQEWPAWLLSLDWVKVAEDAGKNEEN